MRSHSIAVTILAGSMALNAGMVCSQTYPYKPIRIVTAAAGGGSDFDARLVAQGITGALGQPVIVDNRSSVLPGSVVAHSPPDGYTLLVNGQSHWILPLLQRAPYDPVADFSPICLIERSVWVVVVHPFFAGNFHQRASRISESQTGELNYSTSGIGTGPHLSMELFKSMAGVNIVHVPYKGAAAQNTALAGAEVQVTISGAAAVMPLVVAGKLKALAVTSAQPSALVPGLPTVAASGLPGYESVSSAAIFAPAKTPSAIINRLNQEIVRFLNRSDVKETFFKAGEDVVASSPEQLAAVIKSDMSTMGKVIKSVGIRAE